jgi:NodT family efflux transporter outer membrane factor (OMF) lipoprotein
MKENSLRLSQNQLPSQARLAWFFCFACACAGCVATPLPDLHVALPPSWQHLPPYVATATPQPADRWWRVFADPRLDAVVDQALAANLDIAQAAARLRAARALHRRADAPLRPNVHFRTSDPIDPDASASYLVAGFDSTWELGLFGRSTAIHRIANADLATAKADLWEVRLSVPAEISREWIMLRAAQRREALLARIRDLRAEQARLSGQRLSLRLATPQQALQAQAAVAQAEGALAEPREAAATSAQALAVLLGRSEPDPAWMQPGALPGLGVAPVSSAPADLLRTRPDIARDQAAVLRAAGELGIAKADRYPSIAIGGSIVASVSEAERVNKNPGAIGSFGPILDIPLFDWGMRRAQAEAKGELLQAAALAYRKTVLTAAGEVETALAALEQQRLRELASAQAWQALSDVADRTERRRSLHLASGLDSAGSDADRVQAELELAVVRSNRAIDYIALCKTLGGGPGSGTAATTDAGR